MGAVYKVCEPRKQSKMSKEIETKQKIKDFVESQYKGLEATVTDEEAKGLIEMCIHDYCTMHNSHHEITDVDTEMKLNRFINNEFDYLKKVFQQLTQPKATVTYEELEIEAEKSYHLACIVGPITDKYCYEMGFIQGGYKYSKLQQP